MKAAVLVDRDRVRLGDHLWFSLQRTLRLPDDGRTYSLPASLGRLPIAWARDYAAAPASWHEDLFVPLYQREALWLGFDAPSWRPCALIVGVGGINAVSGKQVQTGLLADPQNYLVCPPQLWLDGVNAGPSQVRQFVAMPLGSGVTVEGQLTGEEHVGAIQLQLYEPVPGRFPEHAPSDPTGPQRLSLPQTGRTMGLAPGGWIGQRIYADPYGPNTWHTDAAVTVTIHIIDSLAYESITGLPPPPSPIDAQTYRERGLPWFELYDEHVPAVSAAARFGALKSLSSSTEHLDTTAGNRPIQDG